MENHPMLMCVEDAAPVIGIGRNTLRNALDDQFNPVPHVRIGTHRLVNMARVQEWIDAQTVGMPERRGK